MLPQLVQGDANTQGDASTVFLIPSDFAGSFGGIGRAFSADRASENSNSKPPRSVAS